MKQINIAIDGPSGAGKSSIAKALATKLGYNFINTGSFYRAIAILYKQNNWDYKSLEQNIKTIKFDYESDDNFLVNNINFQLKLRANDISALASELSKLQFVRNYVNDYVTKLVEKNKGFILEGRDTTFKIAPNAELRIFLDASVEERARRRMLQSEMQGTVIAYEKVVDDLNFRDHQDRNREIDPLHVANGVLKLDNDQLNEQQTIDFILGLVYDKCKL